MTTIHADHPKAGWYRYRKHKDAPWEACAIFPKNGNLVAIVGMGKQRRPEDPVRIWTYVADKPVTKEAAKHAFDMGFWPDEPDPSAVRSNLPEDPYERLKALIEDKTQQAQDWINKRPTILQQADCDLARNMQAGLLELNKQADALFKKEKAPLLEAAEACDEKYRFRTHVKNIAAQLADIFGRWMATEQKRREAEAKKKFEDEKARVEAERAALQKDDPIAFHTGSAPELPWGPEPVAKVQVGGGVGRKAGLRTVWLPKIVDYKAAALHVIEHPDIKAEVERIIKHMVKDAKGTIVIPGVEIIESGAAA